MAVTEGVLAAAFAAAGVELEPPFPRLPYDEAIARFGTDRPDTALRARDPRPRRRAAASTEFKVFRGVLERRRRGARHQRRRARAVARRARPADRVRPGPGRRRARLGLRRGGRRLALAGREVPRPSRSSRRSARALEASPGRPAAAGRRRRGRRRADARARCASSSPSASGSSRAGDWKLALGDRLPAGGVERRRGPLGPAAPPVHLARARSRSTLLDDDPAAARARAYDVVLNGAELGGGSIRINRPEVQYRVLETLGIGRQEADERFGFLIEALKHGAPPHGGIALRARPASSPCSPAASRSAT